MVFREKLQYLCSLHRLSLVADHEARRRADQRLQLTDGHADVGA